MSPLRHLVLAKSSNPNSFRILIIFLFSILLNACGGGGGGSAAEVKKESAVINKSSVAVKHLRILSGSLCPSGGIEIKTGIDSNQNGLLDDEEVTNTQNICHGIDGIDGRVSLIEITDELAGEQCLYGGIRINTGLDVDSNGVLSNLEITQSQYICNGANGEVGSGAKTALSEKALIRGRINVSSMQRRQISSSSSSETIQTQELLLLVPSNIEAAIQQNQQNPNAPQPVPIISPVEIQVNEQGNYEVEVPAGTDYSLILVDEQGANGIQLENIDVSAGATVIQNISDTDLIPTGGIRFNITSLASGIVMENADVSLLELGMSTTTDIDGNGLFNNVPEGNYALVISKDGFVNKHVSLKVNSGSDTDLITLELSNQKGSAIGQIQAEGLTNQANLIVYVRAADNSVYSTLTNTGGIFSFPALPVGEDYSFIIAANDFQSIKVDNVQIVKGESTSLGTIKLERTTSDVGSISGYARFAETDEAKHAGIIISVEGTDKEAISSRDGAFVINGLAAGEYTLNYTDSNHATVTRNTVSVVAISTTNLEMIEMQGYTGTVSGVVQLPDGQVLSGVTASINNNEVTTDEFGQFTLSNVLMGEQKLTIRKTGYVTQELYVNISVDSTLELSEALKIQPFQFSGNVSLGEDVIDHSGVQVVLNGYDNATTFTDSNGDFNFAGAVPGNYQITLSKNGFKLRRIAVTLPEAKSTSDDNPSYILPYSIILNRLEGIVKGVVTLSDQLDHSGILVEVVGTTYGTITNAGGEWIMKVPVGNYSDGFRYKKALYQPVLTAETVTVTEYGDYVASAENLTQISAFVSFNASAMGSCPAVNVNIEGVTGAATGYSATFTVDDQGNIPTSELALGNYTITVFCSENGWESYTFNTVLNSGVLNRTFEPVSLRQSFVKINNEDVYTNNSKVTLTIGNTDAVEMRIEEGMFDSDWIDFSESQLHILSAGDGNKTVSVRFRDSSDAELSSVQDVIKLDTTLEIISFTAANAHTKGDVLHFSLDLNGELDATVTASVTGLINGLPLLDNGFGGDATPQDGIYERDFLINSAVDINQRATATATDIANNTVSVNSIENVVLNTAPAIKNLTSSSNVSLGEMTLRFSTDEPATALIEYGENMTDLSNSIEVSSTFITSHSVTLKELSPNSLTYYQISVADSVENSRELNGQGKLAPPPVTGLGAYPGNSEVGLIWNEVARALGYNIYRSANGGTEFTLANPTELVMDKYYVDDAVSNGTAYIYRVTSVDVDGNESQEGVDVTVIPAADLAGPTEVAGGVVDINTVWLKSRAPYQISASFKVKEGAELLLLPGTELNFTQPDIAIYLSGDMSALGQADSQVVVNAYDGGNNNYSGGLIFDQINQTLSSFNYTQLNNLKVYSDSGKAPVVLKNSTVNGTTANFTIKSAVDSVFNKYVTSSYSQYGSFNIGSVKNVTFNVLDDLGEPSNSLQQVANLNNAVNSVFNSGSISFNNGSINSSQFTNAAIQNASTITNSTLSNTTLSGGYNGLRISNSTLTDSRINVYNRLTMRFNVLDSESSVSAEELDISYNYWGSTDLNAILSQTGYTPDKEKDTHLYPIITSSLLYLANWDDDEFPDYLDSDNDNDGYSDLQEDWQSDPEFESIFNPLDDQSHPAGEADNDMDGLANADDLDDDNDGLSDADEQIRLTDPLLADSDGDGVDDGDEVSYKYNPLERTNFPMVGNVVGEIIDSSNVNSDGVVYITGIKGADPMMSDSLRVSLNNVTVTAGTALMVGKSTQVVFNNSLIEGNANNIITVRSAGSGVSLTFENSNVDYANIKIAGELRGRGTSVIDHSDLSFSNGYMSGVIKNSLINSTSYFHNEGVIEHSYLSGNYIANNKTIKSSYISSSLKNSGEFISSYANTFSLGYGSGSVTSNSVLNRLGYSGSSSSGTIINSDVRLSNVGTQNIFFDNSYIQLGSGDAFYAGFGEPVDQLGDGVAETVFESNYESEHGGSSTETWTVDGINNPRSASNFSGLTFKPYLEATPIWSPEGVGAWWDMNNPNVFPNSDPVNDMGTISGQVNLEAYNNHSGVRVELKNTSLWTTTDADGNWSIRLPSRDYSGGISFTKDHIETVLKNRSYTVNSQTDTNLGLIKMKQVSAYVKGVLTIDEANDYTLATITATKNGQVTTINASASGEYEFVSLILGDYEFSITYPNGSWEMVTHQLTLVAGQIEYSLPLTRVRNSFVIINNGAAYTNSLNVTLAITNANATNMQISEGGTTQSSVAKTDSSNLKLSAGQGEKTVQVTFTDGNNNALTPAVSAIVLDTQVALNSLTLSPVSTMGDIMHIRLEANEPDGFALVTIPDLVTNLMLFDNGLMGDSIAGDGIYESEYVIDTAEDITAYATANFTDRAGNVANNTSTSQLSISTSPTISELLTQSVNGQLQISFMTNELTTATILYGTDPNNLNQSMTVSATEAMDHSILLAIAEGEVIYFQVITDDGVTTTTAISSSGVVSNTAVTGLNISAGDQEIGLVWNEQTGATDYRIYRSNDSNIFDLLDTVSADTAYFVDDSVDNVDLYYYRVSWLDQSAVESDQTASVSARASLLRAGPTELDGGVIATNEIWLKSRSPYVITGNMLIREDATLSLMSGTEIEFNGAERHIMTRGNIMAYGSELDWVKISTDTAYINSPSSQSAIIYDTSNTTASEFNYTEMNYLKVYYDYTDWSTRNNYLVPLTVNNGVINGYNSHEPDFFIGEIKETVFNEYGYGTDSYRTLRIGRATESTLRKVDANGDLSAINYFIAHIDNASETDFLGAGFIFSKYYWGSSRGFIEGGSIINARVAGIAEIKTTRITNSEVGINDGNNNSLRLTDSIISNSHFNLTGDNTRLTMHYNVLDSDSSVSAKILDISYNYWGNTDLDLIAEQTGYSPDPSKDTHLYPIITGSLLYQADWDKDGLPDYLDYDNDNDGYSDLQEDWESDPVYASIYNPLDGTSYPSTETDNDMDGIKDSEDVDDDNDGLSDTDESTYSTDPFLADSDGDGINDGDEVTFKYNPLDKTNYPLMGNISGKIIDNSNVNSDGVVYIVGYSTNKSVNLSNITVAAGTPLTIEKDTYVTFTDSIIEGDAENVITIRSTGAGNGNLSFNNSRIAYANIKLALRIYSNSNTSIDRSDLSISGGELRGAILNSFISVNSYFNNYASIEHSFITGDYYSNYGALKSCNLNTYFYNYGKVKASYAQTLYSGTGSSVTGSVIDYFEGSSDSSKVSDSDIKLSTSTMAVFFDNSFITISSGTFYDGYGVPEDRLGDGVAETEFSISGSTYTVDGINNPRSTKNFTNGVGDLWNPEGVGALWDSKASDPTSFPEP